MRLRPEQDQYRQVETQIEAALRDADSTAGTPRTMIPVSGGYAPSHGPEDISADLLQDLPLVTEGDQSALLAASVDHSAIPLSDLHESKAAGSDLELQINSSGILGAITGSGWVGSVLTIPGAININGDYQFPTGDGSNGQVLETDGAGALSWTTPSASGTTVRTWWGVNELSINENMTYGTQDGVAVVNEGTSYQSGLNTKCGGATATVKLYGFDTSTGAHAKTLKWVSGSLTSGTDWSGASQTTLNSDTVTTDSLDKIYTWTFSITGLTSGDLLALQFDNSNVKIAGIEITW